MHTTRYFMGTGRIWGPVLVLVLFLVKQTLRMCSSRRKSCIVWGFLLKCNPKGFICNFIGYGMVALVIVGLSVKLLLLLVITAFFPSEMPKLEKTPKTTRTTKA